MNTTPVSLLNRLRQSGEQEVWQRFVDLYTPLLYHWGRQLQLQESDVSDLVQDVLVLLVQKLPEFTYNPDNSFRAWLHTVLMNPWRTRLRRQTPRAIGSEALEELTVADGALAFAEAEYRHALSQCALQLMKAEFLPTTWQACWEQVVNERPAAEVAAELGISEGAAYVAKSRVLRRLRQELDGLLD